MVLLLELVKELLIFKSLVLILDVLIIPGILLATMVDVYILVVLVLVNPAHPILATSSTLLTLAS